MRERLGAAWCMVFHWTYLRDSFGNRCDRCGRYWP